VSKRVEAMYSSLKLEAKISAYLERLTSAYMTLENMLSQASQPRRDLVESKEAIEATIIKLKIALRELSSSRLSLASYRLADVLRDIERSVAELDGKLVVPNVKKWLLAILEDVGLELRRVLESMQQARS